MNVIKWSTSGVVVGIGAVAAYVSYQHAYDLAVAHGETGLTARLLPGTIDGLVYVASMVMLDAAKKGQASPALARWSLGLGIFATLAANVIHGLAHGLVGAVVSAWPAVTLVMTVEMLMGMIRRAKVGTEPIESVDPVVPAARQHFAEDLASGDVPSVRRIMREMRVGHPKAARVKEALAQVAA